MKNDLVEPYVKNFRKFNSNTGKADETATEPFAHANQGVSDNPSDSPWSSEVRIGSLSIMDK